MALTNKLNDIGDAIRAKNGEITKYKLDEMPAAIDRIPTGEPTVPWTRPAAWPNLDLLPIAENEQVVYLSLDNRDRDALLALNTNSNNYTITIGFINDDDEYEAIDSFTTNIANWDPPSLDYFSNIDKDYLVVKITSSKDITFVSFRSAKNKDGLSMNNRQQCSVVEIYYSLPEGTTVSYLACIATQHIKFINGKSFTSFAQAFQDARNLRYVEFENCDTSHVTTFKQMCWGCQSLKDTSFLADLDCSSCTSLEAMFYGAASLEAIDLSLLKNTSSVTSVSRMFNTCSSLTYVNIKGFDSSGVTNFSNFIGGIATMEELDLSSFDVTNAEHTTIISSNPRIMRFIPPKGLNQSISIANGNLVYKPYILELFNALETVNTAPTLTIGTMGLSTLTDDEKAIAINKGWKLA